MKDQAISIPGFPVDHFSYSSWVKFGSNPIMFKINTINGEEIETTAKAGNVLGKTMHKALERFFNGGEGAVNAAHAVGIEYLKNYSDGFIEWQDRIPTRTKLEEKYAFCYFGFLKEFVEINEIKSILLVEKMLKHKINIEGMEMPVPLKGAADLVYEDFQDRITIWDHKITGSYSNVDKIDGAKLVQAVFNYFLVYAETGRKPYRMVFGEYKHSKNQDGSPQLKRYEIIYEEVPFMFELFYRLYADITNALMGNQVYIPNFNALYDNEVAILAYIHRLDIPDQRAEQFKKMKVDNITDFLKKKIMKSGAMKKYLEVVSKNFVSAKTLNYSTMTIQERIKMKLAEHGIGVEFESKITGPSIELYRYEPSIGVKMTKLEAYVKDIEIAVGVSNIRILAPIPNTTLIGFEVPLQERTFPDNIPNTDGFNIAVGQDITGETVRMDIRNAPHLLVAGSTGSGKSVFIGSIIQQLKSLPESDLSLVLLDPKMVELQQYARASDTYADTPDGITVELEILVKKMNDRYAMLKENGCKNLEQYRAKGNNEPYIFVFIDEFADLMNQRKFATDIRSCVLLLAQKARAAGIHVILATQRPSVKIIDGDIKTNFPTRCVFKTASATDSQVVIDQQGAERLLGKGDMLFRDNGSSEVKRLQGFAA